MIKEEFHETYYDKNLLEYYMKTNKITRNMMANVLNISLNALSQKINGQRQFKVNEIRALSKLFNRNMIDVFFKEIVA